MNNQTPSRRIVTRDDIIAYLEAMLVKGITKKEAYLEYIDPGAKNPSQSVLQFERRRDYQELFVIYTNAEQYQRSQIITRVQNKHALLVEKTLDTTSSIISEAETVEDKSRAVRLANETLSALAVVANPPHQEPDRAKLNKGNVVI